ncbi:4-alpha-glucanotransferase [Oxalobacter paraformigenes]|nr:4-alpha-glucanotransferase [Oxalobacter paraformigenes]
MVSGFSSQTGHSFRTETTMKLTRRCGILLHPTSLPGPFGSGDFGRNAYYFVDWLSSARQSLWQMLPLGDIGAGNSPYMSPSAFAGNVLLIGLDALREAGWLKDEELVPDASFEEYRVNFPAVIAFRISRLKLAASRFRESASEQARLAFENFCDKTGFWLQSYALFKTISEVYGAIWQEWPKPLAKQQPAAIDAFVSGHPNEIHFWKFCQWCFHEQWTALRSYAHSKGIDIIGDVPIFVSLNSADVWANPELFDLDSSGYPLAVAGVPPDKFSDSGQHWGNPLYHWNRHAETRYDWWLKRMKHMMDTYDYIRLDHFRGFQAYWAIPADTEIPAEGKWMPGPGNAFFDAMKKEFGPLRFIAEDLGVITPEVNELRKKYELPGMRILQFAFDRNPANPYLPYHYNHDTVAYTGTHDNDTIKGWWNTLPEQDRDFARRYLSVSGDWINWDLIRAAWASTAALALTPYQNILGLDSSARMNRPGEKTGSWEWRFAWKQVESWPSAYLAEITEIYGRSYSR